MLTLKEFKYYLNFIDTQEKKEDALDTALKKYSKEFLDLGGLTMPYTEAFISLLNSAMELTDIDADLIYWYIYDTKFGKVKSIAKIYYDKEHPKKYYDVSSPEKLYKYIQLIVAENKARGKDNAKSKSKN